MCIPVLNGPFCVPGGKLLKLSVPVLDARVTEEEDIVWFLRHLELRKPADIIHIPWCNQYKGIW